MKCLNFGGITMLVLFLALAAYSCTSIDDTVLADQINIDDEVEKASVIDTIITFDPVSNEETVQFVRRTEESPVAKKETVLKGTIDTIITFDPVTNEETIKIVRNN